MSRLIEELSINYPDLVNEEGIVNLEELQNVLTEYEFLYEKLSFLTLKLTKDRFSFPNKSISEILEIHQDMLDAERENDCND